MPGARGLGGLGGGLGGSPSAFTSPGLDPMTLALLLRRQNAGVAGGTPGGPQIPQAQPQQGINQAAMMALMRPPPTQAPQGATATPQQDSMAQLLQSLGGPGGISNVLRGLGIGQGATLDPSQFYAPGTSNPVMQNPLNLGRMF